MLDREAGVVVKAVAGVSVADISKAQGSWVQMIHY